MDSSSIRLVNRAEAPRATSIQVMAFSSDPIMRWMWPEPEQYLQHFPGLVRGFGGGAFEHGGAHVMPIFSAVSLRLPPGVGVDEEALEKLVNETVRSRRGRRSLPYWSRWARHTRRSRTGISPSVGVDPTQQGKGVGAALLRTRSRASTNNGYTATWNRRTPRYSSTSATASR